MEKRGDSLYETGDETVCTTGFKWTQWDLYIRINRLKCCFFPLASTLKMTTKKHCAVVMETLRVKNTVYTVQLFYVISACHWVQTAKCPVKQVDCTRLPTRLDPHRSTSGCSGWPQLTRGCGFSLMQPYNVQTENNLNWKHPSMKDVVSSPITVILLRTVQGQSEKFHFRIS